MLLVTFLVIFGSGVEVQLALDDQNIGERKLQSRRFLLISGSPWVSTVFSNFSEPRRHSGDEWRPRPGLSFRAGTCRW